MRQLELAQLVWSEKGDGVFSSPCTLQYISVWFLSFFSFPVKKKGNKNFESKAYGRVVDMGS